MGLPKADMDEVTAINQEDRDRLNDVLEQISEEELGHLSEMNHDELERFYDKDNMRPNLFLTNIMNLMKRIS